MRVRNLIFLTIIQLVSSINSTTMRDTPLFICVWARSPSHRKLVKSITTQTRVVCAETFGAYQWKSMYHHICCESTVRQADD